MNANCFSVGSNNTLTAYGLPSFVTGDNNVFTGISSLSFLSGSENTSEGIMNFAHGYQNDINTDGLLGLSFAFGRENKIEQSGSLSNQGLNFVLGGGNEIESETETGGNYAIGLQNLIETSSDAGANFAVGIGNEIAFDHPDGMGFNFTTGIYNTIDVTAPASPNEETPGVNFLTGVANTIEGGSSFCYGWGAGLGFSNTYGSFSIGMSAGLAAGGGGGSSTYLQNDVPNSLMVGFSDDATLFVKNRHVGINETSENQGSLYVNSIGGAYGYSVISAVDNNLGKAFAVHNKDGGGTPLETFLIYGSGETTITVDDEDINALRVYSRDATLATVENFRVNGKGEVHARKVVVTTSNFPDYVFDKDYKLPSIGEVKEYIKDNHHLPEVPSAAEAECSGVDVASMNNILLKKIEELTLYAIKQQEQIDMLIASAKK